MSAYAIIPTRAVTDAELTDRQVRLLALLSHHINVGNVTSISRLARELGVRSTTIEKDLQALRDKSYLYREPTEGKPGSYFYRLVDMSGRA